MLSSAWPAPAKLNLFLHIIGRRDDGYHQLQTVFQFISLFDEIDFNILESGSISRVSNIEGVNAKDDLVIRAARKLKEYTGCNKGAEITVRKRIPVGGGLGGGSSDAATTLVALNQLWQTGVSDKELSEIGLELGADIPVFIGARAAWAEGVGERLTALQPGAPYYLVIHPGCTIPTAGIFNAPDLTRNTPAITIRDFLDHGGKNDCETVVRNRYAAVANALDWLSNYSPAKLTGTGACIYAPFNDDREATAVGETIPGEWRGFVVRGLNRSPLVTRLTEEKNRH